MNFDDLPDQQPTQADDAPPPQNFDDLPSFDDMPDQPQVGIMAAAGIQAARGAAPAAGGIAAGIGTGALIGTMGAGPIGTVIGGAVGGLAGGWLTSKAQDWLLDKLGLRDTVSKYSQAAQEQHPIASDVGSAADTLVGMAIHPAATVGQRVAGAAMMGGIEGGQQLATGQYDPYAILANTLAGAIAPTPRGWTNPAERAGAQIGAKFKGTGTGAVQNPVDTQPGTPGRPDLTAEAQKTPAAPTVGDEDEFEVSPTPTKDQQDVANDVTMTSRGVAQENPPVPELPGVGNPVGAPMSAREGAKPNDPERNYTKGAAPAVKAGETSQPTTVVSTAPIHEDVAAALATEPSPPIAPVQTGLDQDVHTPNVQQAAQLPATMDAVDASQVQRQAADAVRQRMASQQQGEAFQPEQPAGPLNPDRAAEPVTVAVTPKFDDMPNEALPAQPSALLKSVHDELDTRPDMAQAKAKLSALPIEEQEKVAGELSNFLNTQKAAETKKSNRPVMEGGIQARSSKDLARKTGALNAIKSAADKFIPDKEGIIPTSVADKASLIDRLKQMVAHATEQNGGVEPTSAYKPRVKPPEWQLLRQAQRVIAKPTPKNIRDYMTAENLLRSGDAGAAKDVQDTARIEGDITNKPDKIGGVEVAAPQNNIEHEQYDMLPRQEGKDNTYVDQANSLRDYVNNLDDTDFRTVSELYDSPAEFKSEVEDAQNPDDVLSHFKQAIAATRGQRPPKMALVPAEDVKGRTFPIKSAADLAPTEPGAAASKGRSLKGSPEFERLAAQYGGMKVPDRGDRLAQEEAAQANPENTTATWANAATKFKSMMQDESGFGKEFPLMRWMTKQVKDATSPDADRPTMEYVDSLPHQFQNMVNRIKNMQMNLRANVQRAADFKLTPAEKTAIYRAEEDNDLKRLPPELQGYYQQIEAPMRDRYNAIMRDLQDLDEKHDLGLDLPKLAEGFEKRFVPRVRTGKQAWDMADETNVDPVTGKTLSNWASTLQDRDFFALQPVDANGVADPTKPRLLVQPTENGWKIMRNGAQQQIKNINASFDGNIGDKLSLTSKKTGPQDYALDHATVREIGQNVKDKDGNPLAYHENSTLAWAQALDGAQAALERMRLLASIKGDPEFLANSTTDKKTAQERGYDLTTTNLPQFQKRSGRDLYMQNNMRWAMDDFNGRGFNGQDWKPWDQVNRLAAGLIKPMYFFGPFLHALNETDKWVTSRGFDWVPGTGGWKSLATTGYNAIKDVNTQGQWQQLIRENGGNPMYAHALTRDLVPQFAKMLGEDITSNPSKWDPLAKMWGIDTAQLARTAYNASSKPMWYWSDVLLTQKVMENVQKYGMKPADAVADAHKWIDDYIMPTTVGGNGQMGRAISKALSTPGISLFGPYHRGLFNTLGNLTKDVVKTPRTILKEGKVSQANTRAIGQLMMGAAVVWGLYPMLDKAVQSVTGNEDAEFGRRGLSQVVKGVEDIANQKKPKNALMNDVFTPSIPLNMGIQALNNRDWKGSPIVEQGAGPGQSLSELADWLAREAVPPYSTVASAAVKRDATPASVAGHAIASQVGVHVPSAAESKYNRKLPKTLETQMKTRVKHPQGPLEELYNTLTQ